MKRCTYEDAIYVLDGVRHVFPLSLGFRVWGLGVVSMPFFGVYEQYPHSVS